MRQPDCGSRRPDKFLIAGCVFYFIVGPAMFVLVRPMVVAVILYVVIGWYFILKSK